MSNREPADSRVVWLTGTDGWEHAISDDNAARGMLTGDGIYESVCGQRVVSAPLVAPPGRRCAGCVRLVTDVPESAPRERRRPVHIRNPLGERLLRWRGRPPGMP
jgi:hypothetical protein